jgi:hypothetical protein
VREITLTDAEGGDINIVGKSIYQPRLNLGHLKAPARNGIKHFNKVLTNATGIADTVVKCGGTREESRMYFDTVWRPAVEYTLSQSFLS